MDSNLLNDRFDAANEILGLALDVPPGERAAFVHSRCGEDRTLEDSILRLLKKFDDLGDFLEQPAAAALDALVPGATLAGRFHILRKLGAGGMGEVFQAEDSVLQEVVALKVIRPLPQPDPELEARFRSEIRLARKISHPNVCRTNDVFSDAIEGRPFLFFTMEFIEGETLAAFMAARGPLPPGEVLHLAAQIAAGLDAAHREGIVHRDLKPANIMLAPGRDGGLKPVITDFGLARPLQNEPDSALTQTGQMLGSPRYMAPEQFLGTEITAAADIYALALIVVEMIAGKRVFPDESLVRAAVRRATQDAPPLSQLASNAPPAWSVPLARALSRDPAARTASAPSLIRDLETARAPMWRPSRRAVLIGASAATVSGIIAALRLSGRSPIGPIIGSSQKAPTLMLTPLTQPAATNADIRGDTLTLLLTKLLGQSSRVQLLSADRITEGWKLVRTGDQPMPAILPPRVSRHIALMEGAPLVLFGSIGQVGDDWALTLRLELVEGSPDRPKDSRSRTFQDASAAAAVTAASNWIRRAVSEPEMQIQQRNRRPEELTTSNWHSLQQFSESRQAYAAGNVSAAVDHLREALYGDPQFAMAAARLGDILTGIGRADEGLPYYAQAEKVLLGRGLTDRESLEIRGSFALDTGRFDQAEHVFSLFSQEFPDDTIPLLHRATALDRLGRPEEAEKLLDTAIAREPKNYTFLFRRAHLLLDEGRLLDAERDCKLAAVIANNDWTDQLRSAIAYGRLDIPAAIGHIDRLRTAGSKRFNSKWYAFQASYLLDTGDVSAGECMLRDGIAFDLRTGLSAESSIRKRCQLAEVLIQQGGIAEARAACRAALSSAPGIETRLRIAAVLARAGDRSAASYIPKVEPQWPTQLYWLARLRGELALARGEAREAVRVMSEPSAGRTSGEFPVHLLRAAKAAGDTDLLNSCLQSLFANPGRYWFQTSTSELGFVRLALNTAQAGRFNATEPRAASAQRALANFFLRRS